MRIPAMEKEGAAQGPGVMGIRECMGLERVTSRGLNLMGIWLLKPVHRCMSYHAAAGSTMHVQPTIPHSVTFWQAALTAGRSRK